jgi:hypothetical protein
VVFGVGTKLGFEFTYTNPLLLSYSYYHFSSIEWPFPAPFLTAFGLFEPLNLLYNTNNVTNSNKEAVFGSPIVCISESIPRASPFHPYCHLRIRFRQSLNLVTCAIVILFSVDSIPGSRVSEASLTT